MVESAAGFSGSVRKVPGDGGASMNNSVKRQSFGSPGAEGCPTSGPPAFRVHTKKSAYVTRCPSASSEGWIQSSSAMNSLVVQRVRILQGSNIPFGATNVIPCASADEEGGLRKRR